MSAVSLPTIAIAQNRAQYAMARRRAATGGWAFPRATLRLPHSFCNLPMPKKANADAAAGQWGYSTRADRWLAVSCVCCPRVANRAAWAGKGQGRWRVSLKMSLSASALSFVARPCAEETNWRRIFQARSAATRQGA